MLPISPTSLLFLLRKSNCTKHVAQHVVPKQAVYATHDELKNKIMRSLIRRQHPRGLAAQKRFRHFRHRVYFSVNQTLPGHQASCAILCGTRSTCDSGRTQKGKSSTTTTASSRPRRSEVVSISPTSLLLLRKSNGTRCFAQGVVPPPL